MTDTIATAEITEIQAAPPDDDLVAARLFLAGPITNGRLALLSPAARALAVEGLSPQTRTKLAHLCVLGAAKKLRDAEPGTSLRPVQLRRQAADLLDLAATLTGD